MPRLSVVVPVHDVRPYLPGFLDSLTTQTYDDVELLLVDDGSTDGSVEVLRAFAEREPRAVLLEQANAGAGSARNRALDVATGELLAFADPDDELPADAWARMVGVLDRTGSDLVIGSAERFGAGRTYVPPLLARNHGQERLGITIADAPLLLADIFLWNKVVRRELWGALRFPEGTDYEDQPVVTDLLLAARSLDVLTDVVYRWRERADRSSATQARARLANLRDRIETKRATLAAVRRAGDPRLVAVLLEEVLPIDMWEHFRAAAGPVAGSPDSAAYWELLRDGVRELWAEVPFERTRLPVRQRLMGWLTAQDRRDDLVRLVAFLDDHPGPIEIRDGRYVHPWADEPGLPAELLRA